MVRALFHGVLFVGLMGMGAWSQAVWAADPPPAIPDTSAKPPALPAAPVAGTPDLVSLLKTANVAYSQPDKAKAVYHVMVESGNNVTLVRCTEDTAKWKYPDGGTVKMIHFFSQITPWYTQDNEAPAKMLRAIVEENDKAWFCAYTLTVDKNSGGWSLWADSYMFLRGATPEVFRDYLLIVSGIAQRGKDKFIPMMAKSQ